MHYLYLIYKYKIAFTQVGARKYVSKCHEHFFKKLKLKLLHVKPVCTMYLTSSDEFELKFPELSQAELGRLRAEPSLSISIFELKPS